MFKKTSIDRKINILTLYEICFEILAIQKFSSWFVGWEKNGVKLDNQVEENNALNSVMWNHLWLACALLPAK